MATSAEVKREEEVRQLVHELSELAHIGSRDLVLVGGVPAMIRTLVNLSEQGEYRQMSWIVQGFLIGHDQALKGKQKDYSDLLEKTRTLLEKLYP